MGCKQHEACVNNQRLNFLNTAKPECRPARPTNWTTRSSVCSSGFEIILF